MSGALVSSQSDRTKPTKSAKECSRRVLTQAQWLEEGKRRFGPDFKQWKFVCPACGTVQSLQQLLDAVLASGGTKDQVHGYMAFSCIGRFTGQGDAGIAAHGRGEKWDKGCNWTLGGLLQIHELEIIMEEGGRRMAFEFAGVEANKLEDRRALIGKRVIVYSGPHYGKVHQVEGVNESLAHLYHSTSGDRFSAPFCDLEVVS